MTKTLNFLAFLAVVLTVAGGFFVLSKKSAGTPAGKRIEVAQDLAVNNNAEEKTGAPVENILSGKNIASENNIPDKILISVPFTSQAPLASWDELHEEACEEASLIMLKYYLDKKPLASDIAENEIQRMASFEIKNYGDFKDTAAEQTVKLFYDFFGEPANGKKLKAVYDFPKEDLKKYLAEGNPVIIPAAGRLLGNPNFTAPGPLYHNLVLIGYDGNKIITNDPGTRKGRGYAYNIDVLYNAIHDFPGKPEDIMQGRKAMIVLENQ